MRVVLVNPPYAFWQPQTQYLSTVLGCNPPIGLLSLAAYARQKLSSLDITIIDAVAQGLSVPDVVDRIVELKPDLVGITITTAAMPGATAIAETLASALPEVVIIVGGPHVSGNANRILDEFPQATAAIYGEGEITLVELIEAIESNTSVKNVHGTITRSDDESSFKSPPREYIENLDTLPMPAWDLLPDFPAAYPANVFFSPAEPVATLVTSRGCPFSCKFCDQSTFGRRFQSHSPQNVVEMIEHLQNRYQVRYINFYDDIFTMNKTRVMEICERLVELKKPVKWSCDANVMTVDEEMLTAMKKAGCWSISFGIESGCPDILKSLDKKNDLDRVRQVVTWTHEAGIRAKGLFIMGTPFESIQSIERTRELIQSLPFSTINLSKFTAYPGSPLFDEVEDQLKTGYEQYNAMNFLIPTKHLTIDQLEVEYEKTLRRFFRTNHALKSHLPIMLGRPKSIYRIIKVLAYMLVGRIKQRLSREHQ